MPTRPADARQRWRRIADLATLAACAVALASVLVGGIRLELLGLTLSIRNPWRPFLIGVVIAAVRHMVFPGPSVFRSLVRQESAALTPTQASPDPSTGSGSPRAKSRGERSAASRGAWAHAVWPAAGVLCFFFAMTAAMHVPQVMQPYGVPDHGDPLFSIWRLSWVAHQLPRDPWHLFDANIFHPNPGTLAYSDAMLLPALAAAPFLWMGVPAVLVYNLLLLSAIALSGATMCGLVRSLTGRWDVAVLSGLLFAFCTFRYLHYSHFELQMTVLMPVTLYALHKTIATGRVCDGALTGLALGLQTLSSFYYGVFFSLVIACITLILWVTRQFQLRHVAKPLAIGALVALALVVPASLPHWHARAAVGERPWDEVAFYSTVPRDYLTPNVRSVYRDLRARGPDGERDLFPGAVPIALTALALWPPLSPVRLAYACGLLSAYELSFGTNGHTYPLLYHYVPAFHAFRAPARFAMFVTLTMSVLAGLGLARILRPQSDRVRLAVVGSLALLFAIEARPKLALAPLWMSPPPIYSALPTDRTVVIADLPLPTIAQRFTVGQDFVHMYFSTFHWHRLINGASGFSPKAYYELREGLREFPSPRSRALLRRYGVEYVVVHERFYLPEIYARIRAELAQVPDLPLVVAGTWEGTEIRLHRLVP